MGLLDGAIGLIKENPLVAAAGAVGAGVAVGVGGAAIVGALKSSSGSKRKRKARSKHTKKGLKQDRKRRSREKWEVAYQRRKRRNKKGKSRRGIHYTKKGQPYIILASGKAKFVKKTKRRTH